MQLTELEQQISSKLELTNEMNSLLVQRACRIEELENVLASVDSTGPLCNSEACQVSTHAIVRVYIATYVYMFLRCNNFVIRCRRQI